jgi:type IV pilus assembly protein PilB
MAEGSSARYPYSTMKRVRLKDFEPVTDDLLTIIPEGMVRKFSVIPLLKSDGRLLAAVPNVDGSIKPEGLKLVAGCPVDLVQASMEEIEAFIAAHYQPAKTNPVSDRKESELIQKLVDDAVVNRALEVLVEREGTKVRIRQRIRGVMITSLQIQWTVEEAQPVFDFVAKSGECKETQGVRWAESRLEFKSGGENWFCNLVLTETPQFGVLSIRLSSNKERVFSPDSWGMGPHQAKVLGGFLQKKQGMILFCGIASDDLTGNLHACARTLATPEKHVIAVESQMEELFPTVEQLIAKGNPEFFTQLLQLAFRHGPDVVLVNPLEKREHFDLSLAEVMKGRLILGRYHAKDAADALIQILTMGVPPYLIGSGLLGIVVQRRLRLTCPQCQDKDPVSRDELKDLGIPIAMQPTAFFYGRGCDACAKTGFDRETNIYEILEMSEEARSVLHTDVKAEAIRAFIKNNGMLTLRQVAVHKAINGQTSLAEVLRVTS